MKLPRFARKKIAICGSCFSLLLLMIHYYEIGRPSSLQQHMWGSGILDKVQQLNCTGLDKGEKETRRRLKSWTFDFQSLAEEIVNSADKCDTIKRMFHFQSKPLSIEEAEYPLAYGIVVHKNFFQVLLMISSIYHPQNEYCLAVSGSANSVFKDIMETMKKCFPNIEVLQRPNIEWGNFEVINSTYSCLEALTHSATRWKYFQYLSGVDIPLKTNREMVEIFKSLNNTINAELNRYQPERARDMNLSTLPLQLYKSSLSALIPRAAANTIVASSKTRDLLRFLSGTTIPDEAFWGTLYGNYKSFPIPGGVNADVWLNYSDTYNERNTDKVQQYLKNETSMMNYYLSRYQVWYTGCEGKLVSSSCVFGLGDYATLIRKPHLVAHKLYIDFEPATLFCALKEIHRRTSDPVSFDTSLYREIPQVELQRGVPFENLTHPEWLIYKH